MSFAKIEGENQRRKSEKGAKYQQTSLIRDMRFLGTVMCFLTILCLYLGNTAGNSAIQRPLKPTLGAATVTIVPVIPISFEGAGAFRDGSGLKLGHDNGSTLPCPELLLEQTPVRWARSISVRLALPFSLIQFSLIQLSARRLYGWTESSSAFLAR